MNANALYQMVRADFLERIRRYSFLLTLAAALYLGFAVATEKVRIVLGNSYRGEYNSAWIGASMALCCSTWLSLVGFYVVKGSVQRDTDTRVGQILAATPMRKSFYTLAKTISNFAVLASMVMILMLAAVLMQLLHGEASSISVWELWAPLLLITLPAMAITAALAVLFETVPLLKSGLGNVAYFFAWTAGLAASIQLGTVEPTGLQIVFQSTRAVLSKIDASHKDAFSLTVGGERAVRTFVWNGVDWTAPLVLSRFMWIGVAVAIALVASLFFHRFDPAGESWEKNSAQPTSTEPILERAATPVSTPDTHLTPLLARRTQNRFLQLVISELHLMLKGQRWWWYAGAAGVWVGSLVAPDAGTREGFLLVAWIWPILLWSQMGTREARFATHSLIFSSERALHRQLPAVWTAGVMLALLTGAGVGFRLIMGGDLQGLIAWLTGALFVPSLALALGIWSGNSKAFEAIYTVWWYFGPLHHTPGFDFIGTTSASTNTTAYLLASATLLTAAYYGRRKKLGYA